MVKIWNDEGHGGYDPGAIGNGLAEENITLNLGNRIDYLLQNHTSGVQVNSTRDTDVYVSLSERARRANNWGASFFASYHVDAGGGNRFTTYIHPNAPAKTRRIAEAIHKEIAPFYVKHGINDGGVRTGNFAVLRETNMDACLFENGFIDNPNNTKYLAQESFLEQLSWVYARAYAKVLGFKLNSGQAPTASQPTLCRINVGDFDSIEWTAAALTKVKELLPEYGVWTQCIEGSYHRILVGDFNDKKWANDTMAKLKPLGYGMWIQTL